MAKKPAKPQAPQAWTGLKGEPWEPTFSGIATFLRRPHTRDLAGVDVAILGLPYDNATTDRPGARLGPRAIRAASLGLAELKAFPWGFDPFARLTAVDYGDCAINHHLPETVAPTIEAAAAAILGAGARLVGLGGDHYVSYPLLRAHAAKHGPLALVQFDSHSDTWPDHTEDASSANHGSMFRRAILEGIIDPKRSIQVGIRSHNDDPMGVERLTAPWVHREGVDRAVSAIRQRVGAGKAYLTFDIDCLDPAFAPGTGTPVAGGLATWQALEILRGLGPLDIVGMDVVEVSPPFDHAEITALAAATIAHDFLCLLAARKRA